MFLLKKKKIYFFKLFIGIKVRRKKNMDKKFQIELETNIQIYRNLKQTIVVVFSFSVSGQIRAAQSFSVNRGARGRTRTIVIATARVTVSGKNSGLFLTQLVGYFTVVCDA